MISQKMLSLFLIIITLTVNLVFCQTIFASQANQLQGVLDERSDGFFTMKKIDDGTVIMRTARNISVGDLYVDQNNNLFAVTEVAGDTAWARFLRNIELSSSFHQTGVTDISLLQVQAGNEANKDDNKIVIYHTHGAESYVPSDGTESRLEGGGILDVGKSFENALRDKPFEPIRSNETHVPHDANAYQRSRRTAEELLKENPIALFDIHRDAVPAEEYTETVEGKPTVQIQFVVGRQNQNMAANQSFAESLKKTADDIYPGLIKGIFMANGSYNQDLQPSSLLLEVGSHENTKEGAQKAISLFADVVESYYFGAEAPRDSEGLRSVALRSVLWLVVVALVAVGIFMLLSTGSREEFMYKIRNFFRKDLSVLGNKNKDGDDK